MADPTFIHAFDSLGADRFVGLCGALFSSRYKGFLLSSVGSDGGIDAELDNVLGEWKPESTSPLLNSIIQPGKLVVFQFKHKVVARVGEANTRSSLLSEYKCTPKKQCELHRHLIQTRQPSVYVAVTNIEVNSEFRTKFIEQCRSENPAIAHYQIIGLDDLETWIKLQPEIGHSYFPSIFPVPRFNLKIEISEGFYIPTYGSFVNVSETEPLLQVEVMNLGLAPSYVNAIQLQFIKNGQLAYVNILNFLADPRDQILRLLNPAPNMAIEPGNRLEYKFRISDLKGLLREIGSNVFPTEIWIHDKIGNLYSTTLSSEIRNTLLEH